MEPIFYPKLISTFKKGYTREQFLRDVMAGAIVGVVALPLAIAFAIASGVSPEKGLITAIIAGFLVSVLGGSRVQIGGPTGAFVVIVAGIIAGYGLDGLIISTIMAGFMMIGFGLLRMGVVIKYIPYPLTVGFTSGIALLIFVSQLKDFFGLSTGDLPVDFVSKIKVLASSVHTLNWQALLLAVISVLEFTGYSKEHGTCDFKNRTVGGQFQIDHAHIVVFLDSQISNQRLYHAYIGHTLHKQQRSQNHTYLNGNGKIDYYSQHKGG
jgi:SulP family sulfate permease